MLSNEQMDVVVNTVINPPHDEPETLEMAFNILMKVIENFSRISSMVVDQIVCYGNEKKRRKFLCN